MATFKFNFNDDSRPVWAALTFLVLLIGVGVPVWWNTTTVQRASSLPLTEISYLVSGIDIKQNLTYFYKSQDGEKQGRAKAQDLERLLNSQSYNDRLSIQVIHHTFCEEELEIVNAKHTIMAIDELLAHLNNNNHQKQLPILTIVELPDSSLLHPEIKILFGRHNLIYISNNVDVSIIQNTLHHVFFQQLANINLKGDSLPISTNYNIILTSAIANSNVDHNNITFAVIKDYLNLFTKKIADITNVSVFSQTVYLGNRRIDAEFDQNQNHHLINEDKVVSLINALEPKLGSELTDHPTFHWVLYMPNSEQSPLRIVKNNVPVLNNVILSPRWNGGGFQIINDDYRVQEQNIAATLLGQLRNALGFKNLITKTLNTVHQLNYDEAGVHVWELESLVRQRTYKFLNQACSTLKSLHQLLFQIENIVVSDEIRDLIVQSVKMYGASKRALEMNNLSEAYSCAQLAFTNAEKAFFDPSLLALLYFPDDQKYAIYIPLFLPVGIPVLLSLRSVFKHFI